MTLTKRLAWPGLGLITTAVIFYFQYCYWLPVNQAKIPETFPVLVILQSNDSPKVTMSFYAELKDSLPLAEHRSFLVPSNGADNLNRQLAKQRDHELLADNPDHFIVQAIDSRSESITAVKYWGKENLWHEVTGRYIAYDKRFIPLSYRSRTSFWYTLIALSAIPALFLTAVAWSICAVCRCIFRMVKE